MYERWSRDSEFRRLLDADPARPLRAKPAEEHLEREGADPRVMFVFDIHALADDRLLGFIGLGGVNWSHGDSWLFIGIGDRADWSQGCGSDALKLILRYGFAELNLHRVSLTVFEYNGRAMRTYEKAGFVTEGRVRAYLNREGRRWDVIYMGVLRADWSRRWPEADNEHQS